MKYLNLLINKFYKCFFYIIYKRGRFIPDRCYLKVLYRAVYGRRLNLKKPLRYSEKLQWIKLYDRNPNYINMVDKFEAKSIVSSIIGNQYIVPTIGVFNNWADIKFENLPEQFVIKCTHDSGSVFVCKEKKQFNIQKTRDAINKALSYNFYWNSREWPYKSVKPRILIEEYMPALAGEQPLDYKFFCFNGVPKYVKVNLKCKVGHKSNWYTLPDWKFVNNSSTFIDVCDESVRILKPDCIDRIYELIHVLTKGLPQVRLDFYIDGNNIFFGEFTFFHGSGFEVFKDDNFDLELGSQITII